MKERDLSSCQKHTVELLARKCPTLCTTWKEASCLWPGDNRRNFWKAGCSDMEVARSSQVKKRQKIKNMLARTRGYDGRARGEQLSICFSPREDWGQGLTSDLLNVFISDFQILAKPLPKTDSLAWVSCEWLKHGRLKAPFLPLCLWIIKG